MNGWSRKIGWLVLAGVFLATQFGAQVARLGANEPNEPQQPATERSVELTIDYGDGVEKRFTALPYQSGLTVLGLMELASQHPRGVKFEYRGKGETAFLKSIDGLANEGRGRNWIFLVNDRLGETSFAIQSLQTGDKVRWRFGKYDGK